MIPKIFNVALGQTLLYYHDEAVFAGVQDSDKGTYLDLFSNSGKLFFYDNCMEIKRELGRLLQLFSIARQLTKSY